MQSTTRRRTCEDIPSGKSFKKIKGKGPKTAPCGIPEGRLGKEPEVTAIDEEETH